jgi:hypothetical protein
VVEKTEKPDIIEPSKQRDVDAKTHHVFSLIWIFDTLIYRENEEEHI